MEKKKGFWKKFVSVAKTVLTLGIAASKAKVIRGSVGGALEKIDLPTDKNKTSE